MISVSFVSGFFDFTVTSMNPLSIITVLTLADYSEKFVVEWLCLTTILGDFVRMVCTNLAAYVYHGSSLDGNKTKGSSSIYSTVYYYDCCYFLEKGLYSSLA